jgi:hypothetical protein
VENRKVPSDDRHKGIWSESKGGEEKKYVLGKEGTSVNLTTNRRKPEDSYFEARVHISLQEC